MPIYQIQGVGKKTNRKRKRRYKANSLKEALRKAKDDGTVVDRKSVKIIPDKKKSPRKKKHKSHDFDIYQKFAEGVVIGFMKLYSTLVACNTFRIAILRNQVDQKKGDPSEFAIVSGIDKISSDQYINFDYISNISLLVYATSLLDTFISETTKFLIMRHPKILIKNEKLIAFDKILSSPSKATLVTDIISDKVRSISYSTFMDRIEYLRKSFGLKIKFGDDTTEGLEHFSGRRNVIVHDQSVFELELDDQMKLVAKQKTCPLHPTPITSDDLLRCWSVYSDVVDKVYLSVVSQVLKCKDNPKVKETRSLLKLPD